MVVKKRRNIDTTKRKKRSSDYQSNALIQRLVASVLSSQQECRVLH